jgi:hypothetical protein
MNKEQKEFIRKSLKQVTDQTLKTVNAFWVDSLRNAKGFPITDEFIDGLEKIANTEMKKILKK